MARFADALASHPAPARLGDISLRYEPSMLIGETPAVRASLWPTLAWLVGVSALISAVGLLLLSAPIPAIIVAAALGATGLLASTWLHRIDRRQRRFVANFATNSLRLDFVTPFVGRPRTMIVTFDSVEALALVEQGDGHWCLTVDFVPLTGKAEPLREVLAAFIPEVQLPDAERLERMLHGAFGLGEIPADSPIYDVPPVDSLQ